ncbi:MAG TPA: IS630 family transposase [Ignavibacteria bacterium]|nr:IS630 family transposase [Ignavibacteria bacterium]
MKKQDARSLSSEAQEALRVRAVKAVLSGRTQLEVAEIFRVSRQSVSIWLKDYRAHGSKALKTKRQGRPTGGTLKPWQSAQIVKAIKDRHPDQLKLPFYLWTREAVCQLIERRFGIKLSVWTIGRYLRRWGFSPQKPVRRAYEQDDKAVQLWLKEEYPAIRHQAKQEKATIFWGDEMGLRSDDNVGRSYGKRGKTPVIAGTGQRFGCNMISAITNQGQLNFMVFKGSFNSHVFLSYLKRLTKQAKQKVFLIVDRHPVHRASKVKKWVDNNRKIITIFFLPSYSPDLNPDEMLNQDVKSSAVGRRRPHNYNEMVKDVRNFLFSRQKQPQIVKNYFKEQHVKYAM